MKRLLLVLALAASGCATLPNGTRIQLFATREILLRVVHSCTSKALLFPPGSDTPLEIIGVAPFTLALQPSYYYGRYVQVTLQSVEPNGKVGETYTESFGADYRDEREKTWVLSDGNSSIGGWGITHTRCTR